MGIYNSFLVFTNNSVVNFSVGLFWLNPSFVISGGKLWSENNMYHSNSRFIEALDTNTRLEKRTIINSMHNEIKQSCVFGIRGSSVSLIINGSLLVFPTTLQLKVLHLFTYSLILF